MTELEQNLLQHIGKHDGLWGWYQLDRAVSMKSPVTGDFQQLEEGGWIVARPGDQPGHPKYALTDRGKQFLAQGADKTG